MKISLGQCHPHPSRTSWMFCIFIISVPSRLQDLRLFSKCSDLTIVHRGPFCCLWEQFCSIRQVLIVKSKNMRVVYFHLLLESFCDFVYQCISLYILVSLCGVAYFSIGFGSLKVRSVPRD